MSSKVDDRIVNMKFNNSQFEKGVSDTAKSLETLKKGLNLKDVGKGIGDLAGSLKNLSLDGLVNGVQNVASKFSALSVIGITALANIANKAVDAGLTLARSLTIDPIKQGFDEYELKMGSIQTMLANTERYGTKLPEVTANLDELNAYADKTIYNFGDMTKNIGLFTNAGIKIGDATQMIKGFSNVAAASGTSAQGAAGAAYQLSQALSAGTIRLMDWRSLTNVGMGNKNMQNGLIEIADAMGTLDAASISSQEVAKDFNGSLEKQWLSADVMSSYLKIMAGEMTAAEQASLGLSDAQIAAFAKSAATAEDAATKVRTWTQLVGTLQEGVGSGWAQTFDIILGDFDQATELFTAVNNAIGPMIDGMSKARNDLLEGWAKGGGRDSAINAVANAWNAALALVKPIKEAFQEIFPPMTAQKLIDITKAVENFTKKLMPSGKTLDNVKSTFKGFFAVLDIGWMILKQVFGLFGRLAGAIAPAGAGILGMTGNLGDWLVSVRDAIKNGEGLGNIFNWLGEQGEKVIGVFKNVGKWLGDTLAIDSWGDAWTGLGNAVKAVWEWMQPFFQWVGEAFQNTKQVLSDFFKTMDFNVLLGLLNVGAVGGMSLLLKKGIDKIIGVFKDNSLSGIKDKIKEIFGSVTDTFGAMQQKLKSESLKQIAIAIAILTAAVIALSFVDTAKLFVSLGAITVMFGQMSAMIVIMDKFMSAVKPSKIAGISASMILLATAMVILASAIAIMGHLKWDELARGLIGMSVGLAAIVGAALLLDKVQKSMYESGFALMLFAGAILMLSGAMKILGGLSWDEILRSLTALAGTMALVVASMKIAEQGSKSAFAVFIISAALTVLGAALLIMAKMSWDEIIRALGTLTGSLVLMVAALALMKNPANLKGAAAMVVISAAMLVLAAALKSFAEMSWDEIVRGLVALGGGLLILAGAMALMGLGPVALGSVALLAASAGLMMLAPALALLGTMSWDDIGRGLTMLGASLAILAVGGLLMIPASVGFLLLGAAILAIGTGAFLAGTGMVMFAAGFVALTGAAALGAEAIKMALLTLIGLIPEMMAAFAQGIIDFALVIANGGVEFTAAMTTLLTSLITAIGTVGPMVIDTLWNLLMMMATKLEENVPILVEKGGNLIIGVLNGIKSKVPGIARAGTDLMIALMDAISNEVPRLADRGAKAIIKLVNGISTAIDNNAAEMGRAGGRLAASIVRGMINGIGAGIGEIVNAAKNMAKNALDAAKNFLGIHSPSRAFHELGDFSSQGFAGGLVDTLAVVEKAGTRVGETALYATKKSLSQIANAVASDMSMAPSIRPVLDLSAIKKDAGLIGGLLTPPSLKLDKSVAYAAQADNAYRQADLAAFDLSRFKLPDERGGDINFYQTNNSPKALTNAEIYRKTNNQLSVAKKELTTTDA